MWFFCFCHFNKLICLPTTPPLHTFASAIFLLFIILFSPVFSSFQIRRAVGITITKKKICYSCWFSIHVAIVCKPTMNSIELNGFDRLEKLYFPKPNRIDSFIDYYYSYVRIKIWISLINHNWLCEIKWMDVLYCLLCITL